MDLQKLREIDKAISDGLKVYGKGSKSIQQAIAENILTLFKQEQLKLLEDLQKNGHGGGNFRRLIELKLAELKKEIEK